MAGPHLDPSRTRDTASAGRSHAARRVRACTTLFLRPQVLDDACDILVAQLSRGNRRHLSVPLTHDGEHLGQPRSSHGPASAQSVIAGQVGALEKTFTIAGACHAVDTQNVVRRACRATMSWRRSRSTGTRRQPGLRRLRREPREVWPTGSPSYSSVQTWELVNSSIS
jgi:hypothetical protein